MSELHVLQTNHAHVQLMYSHNLLLRFDLICIYPLTFYLYMSLHIFICSYLYSRFTCVHSHFICARLCLYFILFVHVFVLKFFSYLYSYCYSICIILYSYIICTFTSLLTLGWSFIFITSFLDFIVYVFVHIWLVHAFAHILFLI